jgi:PIN domain nuclease of toxin-antitoxin system
MKLLLDSHIWVWTVLERHRLSNQVEATLRAPGNEWWLSAATFWEVMILNQKKRMEFDPDVNTWIRRTLETRPVQEAPITREIAILSRTLELGTEDPVDRFLAATAIVYDLTLVTADRQLIACPSIRTLANR